MPFEEWLKETMLNNEQLLIYGERMLKKYKINRNYPEPKIEEVDVLRETEHFIFIPKTKTRFNPKGERRESKTSQLAEYHDSWELAHTALAHRAEQKLEYARRLIKSANSLIEAVRKMKPPTADS